MTFQRQRKCRIHHFTGEEQISPKSGQKDAESVHFLTDTLRGMCLLFGASNVFIKGSLETAQDENK